MSTLVSLWANVRDRLRAAGVDSPVVDARLLLEAGAGVTRLDIVTDPHRVLTDEQVAAVDALVKRREAREPVSYIVGKKAFWKFDLAVTPAVLTPRPDTETLVDVALELVGFNDVARVLDLGTGSGAILLAVLSERLISTGIGVDASEDALAIARANAATLGLATRADFIQSDWTANVEGAFDLVLSNPPYIRSGAIDLLEPEVAKHEPRAALDGGRDGLDAYRAILGQLHRVLRPGGAFAFEVGDGQAEAVWALADQAGLKPEGVRQDLAGRSRVVWGRR